jgi:hypothetical protein
MSFVSAYFHVEGCAKIPHMVEDDALRGIFHEIRGKNSLSEVLDLFFVWTQSM